MSLASNNFFIQVTPLRVYAIDQYFFLFSVPSFDSLFLHNGFLNCIKSSKIQQFRTVVFRSKSRIFFLFVLKNPYRQIRRNTNIKCGIINTGHNVNVTSHIANIDCLVHLVKLSDLARTIDFLIVIDTTMSLRSRQKLGKQSVFMLLDCFVAYDVPDIDENSLKLLAMTRNLLIVIDSSTSLRSNMNTVCIVFKNSPLLKQSVFLAFRLLRRLGISDIDKSSYEFPPMTAYHF